MKIKFISISTLLFIVGCSTNPNAMRNGSPDVVHSSVKTPKEIAMCIANRWENSGVVNQREIEHGFSITGSISGNLHFLADITTDGKVTTTKAYKFMHISIGGRSFPAVADCQI